MSGQYRQSYHKKNKLAWCWIRSKFFDFVTIKTTDIVKKKTERYGEVIQVLVVRMLILSEKHHIYKCNGIIKLFEGTVQ